MNMHAKLLAETVANLPDTPGVYIYHDIKGRVLYVGKAISLKKRVSSYFQLSKNLGVKTRALVSEIASIETIDVASEIEALLLEARLIKKYRPPYNVQWKDDKEYLYIKITWKEAIPRVLTARREKLPGNVYFGPFPSAGTVKQTLRTLRRTFPYCNEKKTQMRKDGTNLYTDLGLCPGPHAGLISMEDYRNQIKKLMQFLEGKRTSVIKELEREMQAAAKKLEFERAAKIKKQLDGISYITTQVIKPEAYLENPTLLEDKREAEMEQLKEVLHLQTLPHRIEGYDISTIQGRYSVGSMVVFTDAQPDKRQYRKFRIRYKDIPKDVPNDFWMMREMLSRRFKNDWPEPDLLLIDGGKGQLGAVLTVMEELGVSWPIASLAKKKEELFVPWQDESIQLREEDPGRHLVQRVRDESHRFAITYHKKLRNKETITK